MQVERRNHPIEAVYEVERIKMANRMKGYDEIAVPDSIDPLDFL